MTTTAMKRCGHCQEIYPYHPSTYGFMPQYNDSRYCPACAEAVDIALRAVPVKFEKRWVPTSDYTREQLQEAQRARCDEPDGLCMRRVSPGLFDMEDPGNHQHNVCEMMPDPATKRKVYYSATWWSRKPKEIEVTKEVWWDVQAGAPDRNQNDYR